MPVGGNQVTVTLPTELLQELSNHAAQAGDDDVATFIVRVLEAIESNDLLTDWLEIVMTIDAVREERGH